MKKSPHADLAALCGLEFVTLDTCIFLGKIYQCWLASSGHLSYVVLLTGLYPIGFSLFFVFESSYEKRPLNFPELKYQHQIPTCSLYNLEIF